MGLEFRVITVKGMQLKKGVKASLKMHLYPDMKPAGRCRQY